MFFKKMSETKQNFWKNPQTIFLKKIPENVEAKITIFHYLMHRCVGHTAWVRGGREGRSQAGPKG